MKKVILVIAVLISSGTVHAQELLSKKGTPILPEKGDWSVGIDAVPLINYFGNLFSNAGNSHTDYFTFTHPMTIVGKLMKTPDKAYRGKVRIGFGSVTQDTVVEDLSNPASHVTDETVISDFNLTLGAGIQWMRGKGRLRGIYGVEALFSKGSHSSTYTFGNELTATNTGPRTTEIKDGNSTGFGIRGFIGVEYFFAPKISLSGEFGWGINFDYKGEGSTTVEEWDVTNSAVNIKTTNTGKTTSFLIDTDNADAALVLNFYF
jgi:hypothetical protein